MWLPVLTALLLFHFPLLSHTLIMKNGSYVVGKIKSQNKDEVVIDVNGVIRKYPKSSIHQIEFVDRVVQKEPVIKKKKEVKKKEAKVKELTLAGVMWRSAVIPGWGHYKTSEKLSAAGWFMLNLSALAWAYSKRSEAENAQAQYAKQATTNFFIIQSQVQPGGDPIQPLIQNYILGIAPYNSFQGKVNSYNQTLAVLGVVYVGQMIHALVSGSKYFKKKKIEAEKSAGMNFYILPESQQANFRNGMQGNASFYLRF